jgi:hypothetical protein
MKPLSAILAGLLGICSCERRNALSPAWHSPPWIFYRPTGIGRARELEIQPAPLQSEPGNLKEVLSPGYDFI